MSLHVMIITAPTHANHMYASSLSAMDFELRDTIYMLVTAELNNESEELLSTYADDITPPLR